MFCGDEMFAEGKIGERGISANPVASYDNNKKQNKNEIYSSSDNMNFQNCSQIAGRKLTWLAVVQRAGIGQANTGCQTLTRTVTARVPAKLPATVPAGGKCGFYPPANTCRRDL